MNVIIACEYSGTVRDAFTKLGHNALSCDLLPSESEGYHYQGDIFECLRFHHNNFDLLIGHPPCPYLTVSANKWYKEQPKRKSGVLVGKEREDARELAKDFFMELYNTNIPHIALENPIGIMSSVFRKPDQIIQPYMFGHGETKATCLWLKNLPKLVWSKENNLFSNKTVSEGREQRIFKLPPSPNRWKERSKTYTGIAEAMAIQWSEYIINHK